MKIMTPDAKLTNRRADLLARLVLIRAAQEALRGAYQELGGKP